MGEGFEVLIWLAVMGFIGLRSAMQRSRRQGAARVDDDGLDDHVVEGRQAMMPREADEARSSPPARRRSGVLSRWTEFAAELERQMKEQAEAQRAAADELDDEATVVVPGRRVYPSTPAPRTASVPQARSGARVDDSHWDDWEDEPESHRLHPGGPGGGGSARHERTPREVRSPRESSKAQVERIHRPGLARLESYAALKRAVLLAEVLGPPPGLDGTSPAERRLDRLI